MKKACILMGSPRKNGNTNAVLTPFAAALANHNYECEIIRLYDMKLEPCTACRKCQEDWSIFGCSRCDDMQQIFDSLLASDLIVLATPIYSWYCTPPMKTVLDRMVYGMNKFYGEKVGPSLWRGKPLALITTCGYRPENGADLWERGIKRYCKHSGLNYIGMLAERHLGYKTVFMDDEKAARAAEFAEFAASKANEIKYR